MNVSTCLCLRIISVCCVALIGSAYSAERVALVIGNNAYKHGTPLKNCVNDAKAVAGALKNAGFTVITAEDASLEQMEAKALEFQRAAQGAKAAWFHYSGHGAEVKGVNYLIPIDADVKEEFQVKHKAFAIDQMLGAMEEAGAPLKVVVLDCCRNNPFGRGWSRSGAAGLAQIGNTPTGTIIAFATSPGKVAEDGAGANSPYTLALVATIAKPGLDIDQVFKETGKAVKLSTGNSQQPWISSSYTESFVLLAGGATLKSPSADKGSLPESPPQSAEDAKLAKYWLTLAETGNAEAQFIIGMRYLDGDGVGKDAEKAVSWLHKAAEKGYVEAQFMIAICYTTGDGVGKDATTAATWLCKAANQGKADAQRLLGTRYLLGEGVKKDFVTACMWFKNS